MTRTSFALITGFCALLFAQTASAQPRWGRDRIPQAGACFFEHADFRGDYFCVNDNDRLTSMPRGMGDRISSVRVFGGSEVIVFRDSNLRGRSARFASDVVNLKSAGWNDQISSLDIVRSRRNRNGGWFPGGGWTGNDNRNGNGRPVWGRNQRLPREGACFYEHANFGGEYFCVARGGRYESLPRGFNDRISSIRVINAEVELFQNEDFRGRSRDVRSDLRDLRGTWRDTVSSLRVF